MPIVRTDTCIPLLRVLPLHEVSAKRPVNTLNGFTRKYMSQYLIHSHTPWGKKYLLHCRSSEFRIHFTQECTPQQTWLISVPHGIQGLLKWILLIFTCDGVEKSMVYVANLKNIMPTADKIWQEHNSRMHTARLPDNGTGGGVPQVNKFEQVSSDGHQMSLAGGGARPGGVVLCLMSGGRARGRNPVLWSPMYHG